MRLILASSAFLWRAVHFGIPLWASGVQQKGTQCSATHWLVDFPTLCCPSSFVYKVTKLCSWHPQHPGGRPGGAPMWSSCMALMLSPAWAFKALCVFHMARPSLITVPGLSFDWFTMWEPERRRTGAASPLLMCERCFVEIHGDAATWESSLFSAYVWVISQLFAHEKLFFPSFFCFNEPPWFC